MTPLRGVWGCDPQLVERRAFLSSSLAVPVGLLLAACGGGGVVVQGASSTRSTHQLDLTPACDDDAETTVAQTEGPYFKRSSPERTSLLEEGVGGTRLILAGSVVSRGCKPIAGALLDFWQADAAGAYDNTGFNLRGHQFTAEDGRFAVETNMPGLYPGRTRHIHVKVQAPNGPVLTTQLYFPDEAGNRRDGIFSPALMMTIGEAEDGKVGAFTFVVNT